MTLSARLTLFASCVQLAWTMHRGNDISTADSHDIDCGQLSFKLDKVIEVVGSDVDSPCSSPCLREVQAYQNEYGSHGNRQCADVCNLSEDICICLQESSVLSKQKEQDYTGFGMTSQHMGSMPSWAGGITSTGASNTLLLFSGAVIDDRANSNIGRKEGLTRLVCQCSMVVQFYKLRVASTASSDPARYSCRPSAVYDRLLSGTWLRWRSAEDEAAGIVDLQPRRKCLAYLHEHDPVIDRRLCRRSDRQNVCSLIDQPPWYEPFGIGTSTMNVRW